MKTPRMAGGLLAALLVLACVPAWGQPRSQFPTPMSPPVNNGGYVAPELLPGPASSAPASLAPASPAPTYKYGPQVEFDGSIAPPPGNFDPYASPGLNQQPIYPEGSGYQSGAGFTAGAGTMYMQARKFFHGFKFKWIWLPGSSESELGLQNLELNGTFELPFFRNPDSPLLLTPGFGVQYWAGPVTQAPQNADMPPRTYDAYLDTAWNPQPTPWFGGELSFRIGIYSDLTQVTNESIRYMGKGMAVIKPMPGKLEIKFGMWYLDRNKVKILPAGGIVWIPSPDSRFEILFPNPKYARRLHNMGNTELWFTFFGEYGGDNWTVRRTAGGAAGTIDSVDYNDIRVGVGLEFNNPGRISGMFETGVSFERELVYRSSQPSEFNANTTIFLRTGISR